jgi:hypothetical protein
VPQTAAGSSPISDDTNVAAVEDLASRLKLALYHAAELSIAAAADIRRAPSGSGSIPGVEPLVSVPTLPYLIDWCGQWAYGIGLATTRIVSANSPGDAFHDAANQARSNLLEGLFALRVDPDRSVHDLATANPGLRRGILRLVNAGEVTARRAPDGDLMWVEVRLPLVGNTGLIPLILPFSDQASGLSDGAPAPPAAERAARRTYSSILIDARGLAIEPALFPRLVTPTGLRIQVQAAADLNRFARFGYSVYTPFQGQARLLVGGSSLGVRPLEGARIPGEVVISEVDARRIQAANIDSQRLGATLIILTD